MLGSFTRIHRRALLASVGLAALVVSSCSYSLPLVEREILLDIPTDQCTGLTVETSNGLVTVKHREGATLSLRAIAGAETAERVAAVTIVHERDAAGQLHLRPDWPGGRSSREACRMEIECPPFARLHLKTSNGSISVDGPFGEVTVKSSNGRIDVRQCQGPIDVDTSNGAIFVQGAGLPVKAETSNGAVEVRLAPENTGPVDIESSNGSITLAVGPAFQGTLAAKTSNGRVQVDPMPGMNSSSEKNRATLRFAEAGAESRVRTSNGGIHIRAQ